jgi:hypothetical protein
MTRNQWIGAGCGGVGCVGLLALVVVGAAFYWLNLTRPTAYNANSNYNSNRGSDQNSNTTNSAPGSSSSLSDDNRHKLFQAASATHDGQLMKKVNKKLGLVDADDVPNNQYAEFLKEHIKWIFSNSEWLGTINTTEKARAYVDEHIND